MIRKILILIVAIGIAGSGLAGYRYASFPDPLKSGAYSSYLAMSIRFEERPDKRDDQFVITLTNKATNDLELQVDPKLFEGTIMISGDNSVTYNDANKTYEIHAATGLWSDPFVRLAKGSAINWNIPIANMVSWEREPTKSSELKTSEVHAELNRLAVVRVFPWPSEAKYISDNALQSTPTIRIP